MYSYRLGGKGGKEIKLEESKDRLVVRTKNGRSLVNSVYSSDSKNILNEFETEVTFKEADISILRLKNITSDIVARRDLARSILKNEAELRFAGRVLVESDSNTPIVYTENLFVKFHDNLKSNECELILNQFNLVVKQKLDFAKNSYFVSFHENIGLKLFDVAQKLLDRPEVELCNPELIREKGLKTISKSQWHLKKTSIFGIEINANVKADIAHGISKGENITIALIDDGFNIDHEEFNVPDKVKFSRDINLNVANTRPRYDYENHGTPCAGVACAQGIKASGVAPMAKLMPIKLNTNLGSILEANAFVWAADNGADIISCSWGPVDGDWFDLNDPMHNVKVDLPDSTRLAIDYAVSKGRNGKGCIIFFAAGNGNESVENDGYASYSNVIAVAASNDSNKRSVYSDFGKSIFCCFPSNDFDHQPFNHPKPNSKGIYSPGLRFRNLSFDNSFYRDDFGGTSSSCPGAAGVAALILSVNPNLDWTQVKDIIKDTCEKIDAVNGKYNNLGHSEYYGFGKVDAFAAVQKALQLKNFNFKPVIKITSVLVDPIGRDFGNENINLKNTTQKVINLNGWFIKVGNRKLVLSGNIEGGETLKILNILPLRLPNSGGKLELFDVNNEIIDSETYQKSEVIVGEEVKFI